MTGQRNDTGNRDNTGPNRAATWIDDRAARVRDDGRRDTDLDDDRTDQRMAAQREANRQAAIATPQDGVQIDQGSHAHEGMGRARQTDGS